MKNLEPKDFEAAFVNNKNAVIIDVRFPEEKDEGEIENSINININSQDFVAKVSELAKEKEYFIYCRSGVRSQHACDYMEQIGFNTINLKGGILAWNHLKNS